MQLLQHNAYIVHVLCNISVLIHTATGQPVPAPNGSGVLGAGAIVGIVLCLIAVIVAVIAALVLGYCILRGTSAALC